MTGNEVRQQFLAYFERKDHQIVRSSSLVPQDDPTLLFTNAGMVQFKRAFLGEEKRPYSRATTSQKCVRAGGKHNDLENVGYTARHHTFFEMLGNFSFGEYFKEKAIEYGWDLLVNGYGLPADKLWVSIYLDDDEAFKIWNEGIGVPADRIVRLGEKENFWAMGDTGPCGPCSEIHIDRGERYTCDQPECGVDCDCDRFLEIWNLVFMQFNRDDSGELTPLPRPSIDTGLGLERMASVLQDVDSNFDTDLILPIMEATEKLAGVKMTASFENEVAMKVIADHSRASAFLIGDGVLPSNEGRGYVLRRIMRRAIRYGRQIGLTRPFLHRTVEVVFDIMAPAYPELGEAAAFITNVVENEEKRFSDTLDNGLKVLNENLGEIRARGEDTVPGSLIFKLYDTFGFPVDIVRDVVRDEGLNLDMAGFDSHMDIQKSKSKTVKTFTGVSEAYKQLSAAGFTPEFTGYGHTEGQGKVLLLVQDGQEVAEAEAGTAVEVVTDKTPFYGEAGGQVGDVGTITDGDLAVTISDTRKDPTGLIIHVGQVAAGSIRKDQAVTLAVDPGKRLATARNHTATHILQSALREILGDHIKQAGSMVAPDRLRFDFTHFSQVEPATLEAIETRVNKGIRANVPVAVDEMAAEEAFQSGATALFEEKYGDRVRVISLGDFSKELCGGTHCRATGDIGAFAIVSETSVAAGVRRIEAITGEAAVAHHQANARRLHEAAQMFKDKPEAVPARVEKLLTANKALEREVERLKGALAELKAGSAGDAAVRSVKGVQVLAQQVVVDTPAALRDLADKFRDRLESGVVVLGAESDGKAMLIVVVTKDLTDRFHAGRIIKKVAAQVGGGGGGRPDMAQAGGSRPENLPQALESVYGMLEAQANG
jgi:alanyl-tRNA synthetase